MERHLDGVRKPAPAPLPERFQAAATIPQAASRWRGAASGGTAWAALWTTLLLAGCAGTDYQASPTAAPADVYHLAAPEAGACAWFGDARDDVLYFGIAGFWSELRAAGGDPEADLASPAPRWVGRFSLAEERMLAPLVIDNVAPSGVWDVLAHPNGRVYFSTYFGPAGAVDPETQAVQYFEGAGLGLNEIVLGPDGTILFTRYGYGADARGSVVVLAEDGRLLRELPLEGPPGLRPAAKSLAFDPLRREIWLNTDLFELEGGAQAATPHDTRILSWEGPELARFEAPEVQFMTFAEDGTGAFAELHGTRLELRWRLPEDADRPLPERPPILLDDAFPVGFDFVQDVRVEDGVALVTRWSGRVHRVAPDGTHDVLALPRAADDLYYSATSARGTRICATRCGGVVVACQDR